MKKKCAKEALKYIKDNSIVGLGGGSTISHLVDYIKESNLNVKVVTPSFNTEMLCIEKGIQVIPTWSVNEVDIAFDGCDEVDSNLNALKSGGGIHTKEKIIAKMSKDYILLVDESKVSENLTFKYPVVLEIFTEGIGYVKSQIERLGGVVSIRKSKTKDCFTISDNGLLLMDVVFRDIEDIENLDKKLKNIVGVVDTSLFYNIATKAIVVSEDNIRLIEK